MNVKWFRERIDNNEPYFNYILKELQNEDLTTEEKTLLANFNDISRGIYYSTLSKTILIKMKKNYLYSLIMST